MKEGEEEESEGLDDSEELDDEGSERGREEPMDLLIACLVDLRSDG